jgi:uncharacterized protein (DUF1810 family)
MSFDPHLFLQAQDPVFEQVRRELRDGRKRSHWMWFVFPQLSGLGHSAMARRYSLASVDEAAAYLKHPILKQRLIECTELVNRVEGRSINAILGSPDDLKFHSCMTLFSSVPGAPPDFADALTKYFGGTRDRLTSDRIPLSMDEHEVAAGARRLVGPEDEVRSGPEATERPSNEMDD